MFYRVFRLANSRIQRKQKTQKTDSYRNGVKSGLPSLLKNATQEALKLVFNLFLLVCVSIEYFSSMKLIQEETSLEYYVLRPPPYSKFLKEWIKVMKKNEIGEIRMKKCFYWFWGYCG